MQSKLGPYASRLTARRSSQPAALCREQVRAALLAGVVGRAQIGQATRLEQASTHSENPHAAPRIQAMGRPQPAARDQAVARSYMAVAHCAEAVTRPRDMGQRVTACGPYGCSLRYLRCSPRSLRLQFVTPTVAACNSCSL